MLFNGQEYPTDHQGYLLDSTQWDEALAVEIAKLESVELGEKHWQVIFFVREFYLEFNTSPAIRALVKAMQKKYGAEMINSRYL